MRIGELADLAGISTRAIRHYHRVGLLAEPARRANGYRDYTLRDAVALSRVRRLAELGLSLGEIGEVLAGDSGRELSDVLRELDADLAAQEADIRRRRAGLVALIELAETEKAPVSPGLARFFGRVAEVGGPGSAAADTDREVLTLLETVARAHDGGWIGALTEASESDPGAAGRAHRVYVLLDELAGAAVDDPRVDVAARAVVAALPEAARRSISSTAGGFEPGFAAAFYAHFAPAQAAAFRLAIQQLREPS